LAKGQNGLPDDESRLLAATQERGPPVISSRAGDPDGRPDAPEERRPIQSFFSRWTNRPDRETADRLVDEDRFWDNQGLLWWAFAFASGIAVYTYLPEEPHWPALVGALSIALGLVFWASRRGNLGKPAILALAVACGVTAGALRTSYVEAPRLGEPMNVTLTGHVLERQSSGSGTRILIEVAKVDGRPRADVAFPEKVRLRVPAGSEVSVGAGVRVRARLFPPAGPVSPGGYDFSYRAYFSQIGATGFSYGPGVQADAGPVPLTVRAAALVQGLRDGLTSRIRSVLADTPERALVIALLVGDRSGISQEQEDDLRAAGLAHILAISGLHMALFAGGAYGAVLFILALFPPLALRRPIHKWAAVAALAAAVAYLLISGAAVATQRSFLMIALVFLGIFVGRRGLTLRSVALAGLFLLLLAPERVFFPGFQMSFAAVICLVAVYELWRQRRGPWRAKDRQTAARSDGRARKLLRFVGKWAAGLIVTAFVAGLATGIVGAYHFGRIAPYGLLGNLLGMPVFSLVIMPMGVFALVLMPFGLSALPLAVMAFGLSVLERIAAFTADLSDGAGAIGTLNGPSALLFVSALFICLLLPGRRRLFAAFPFAAAIVFVMVSRPPDIQIAGSGRQVAARDATGLLRLSSGRQSFQGDLWMQSEGVPEHATLSRKMKSPQRRCDAAGCTVLAHVAEDAKAADGTGGAVPLAVALPKSSEALPMDCRYADIIVTDLVAPKGCRARVIFDRAVRQRRGAISLWLSPPDPGTEKPPPGGRPAGGDGGTEKPVIGRVAYAIPDPPRPWHRPGTVPRASLRQGSGGSSQ